jgi:hypothetical protein
MNKLFLFEGDDLTHVLVLAQTGNEAEALLAEADDGIEYTLVDYWNTFEAQVIRGVFG